MSATRWFSIFSKAHAALIAFLAIAAAGAVCLPSLAHADSFLIDLSGITVTPEKIYSEDTITVRVSFSTESDTAAKVKFALFFDDEAVDTLQQYYERGNHDATLRFSIPSGKIQSHEIKIKAKIYDGDTLKDEDSMQKTIYINPTREKNHKLELVSVAAAQTADPNQQIPVTITLKNAGGYSEDNIQLSAKIDGVSAFLPPFSLASGETVTKDIVVKAPDRSGTYDITVKASNRYDSQSQTSSVRVQRLFITLTLSRTTASVGEWIAISGYVTRDGLSSAGPVNIYKDGKLEGTIIPRSNGYYSTSIRFDTAGTHSIAAIGAGLSTSQKVIIEPSAPSAPAPEQGPIQPKVTENYTARIIVSDEVSIIYAPVQAQGNAGDLEKAGKYTGVSFVNIYASAKELDVVQNRGNLLKVRVENHLGKKDVFSVSSDFDKNWVFLPGADVVEDGEIGTFDIFFNPNAQGTFSGNVKVLQSGNVIKTIPVSVFAAPKSLQKEASAGGFFAGFNANISAYLYVLAAIAAILMAIAIASAGFFLRKEKPLEPKSAHIAHTSTGGFGSGSADSAALGSIKARMSV